jgi:hypothetical protein
MQFRDDLLNDAAAGLSESATQKIMEQVSRNAKIQHAIP